jgi:hypothetical protein
VIASRSRIFGRRLETRQAIKLLQHAPQRVGYLLKDPVETHVGSIFAKLGLLPAADDHRRVLAVLMYIRSA